MVGLDGMDYEMRAGSKEGYGEMVEGEDES